jgi:serine/threonine protein kinase
VENQNPDHTVVLQIRGGELIENRFRLDLKVGQGAMGSVFKGRDEKLGKPVAIKILAPEHCRKPKILARFEREAAKMTTLRHPNIVQFLSHGRRGALPYIVMEYIDGFTLTESLAKNGGSFSLAQTLAIVKQLCSGLSFLHQNGLIHRDIKPQNVILSRGGKITILDLGVVRDQAEPGLTKPGAMVGTPFYMSPEQILGATDIDTRTDVYALGAVTFELLVGHPPYLGNNNFEVLYGHKHLPPPDAHSVKKSVSIEVAQVLQKALAKDKRERIKTADEFFAKLTSAARTPLTNETFDNLFPLPKRSKTTSEVPMADNSDVVSVAEFQTNNQSMSELKTVMVHLDQDAMAELIRNANLKEQKKKSSGELRVLVTSNGRMASAKLFVDGADCGQTPKTLTLSEGPHSLRAELFGFKPYEQTVKVQRNLTVTVTMMLEKLAR